MRTSQSFPFYSSDFILGTMLMTAEEVGAYIRMLCWQWEQGSVPSSPDKIKRITGVSFAKLSAVVEKFDEDSDGNLKNFRMEEVRTDRENFMEVQRQNGKKGGRPKGERPKPLDSQNKPMGYDRVSIGLTQSEPKKTLPSPLPSPLPLPKTPKPPEGGVFCGEPLVSKKEAMCYAPQCGSLPEVAELWWESRDATGWTKKGEPIRKWQSDLAVFARHYASNKAEQDSRKTHGQPPPRKAPEFTNSEQPIIMTEAAKRLYARAEQIAKEQAAEEKRKLAKYEEWEAEKERERAERQAIFDEEGAEL